MVIGTDSLVVMRINHVLDIDGELIPIDPADCDVCWAVEGVPCFEHFRMGVEFQR